MCIVILASQRRVCHPPAKVSVQAERKACISQVNNHIMPLTASKCNDVKMEAKALEQETETDNTTSPSDIRKSAEKILHSKLLKASLQHVRKKLKLDCFPNIKISGNIDVNQKVVHCLPFDYTEIDAAPALIGLEHVNECDSSFVRGNECEFSKHKRKLL
jgi:hypothetical protein